MNVYQKLDKITTQSGLEKPPRGDGGRAFSAGRGDASLDTLAQHQTDLRDDPSFDLISCVKSDDKTNLQKRARSKYFSSAVALRLVDVDSPLKKQYWNTFHCASTIEVKNGKAVSSKYCKNRWCLVCNRIRTADLVNRYKSTLFDWEDRHFVTLTIPNVPSDQLQAAIRSMTNDFRKIKNTMFTRSQRGTGTALVAVRKMECTHNPKRNDYHPHFHVVTKDKATARVLLEEWLLRHPECSQLAQDIRPATKNDLIELFKYFTKILTKTKGQDYALDPISLDIINQAVRGTRTFQPVGFKLPKAPEVVDPETEEFAKEVDDAVFYDWKQEFNDWISPDGECLSEYEPTAKLEALVTRLDVPF